MELINFGIDSRFISIERQFLKYILSSLELNALGDSSSAYDIKNILKKLKIEIEQLYKILDSIMVKRFFYTLKNEEKEISGKFCFISSYHFDGENLILELAKEIVEVYTPNSRLFGSDIENLLCLKSNKSINLYLKVSNSKKDGTGFQISMIDLKNMLEIETEYNRFYDFERYVIKDVIDDINENSFSKISYQKHKKGNSSTHKIESIIFYMLNSKQITLKEETNMLLELVKYRVKDLSTIHHIIRTTVKNFGYLYAKENIEFVLNNKQKDIDIALIRALKENPAYQIQGLITGKASTLICSFDKYYPDLYTFKSRINDELQKQGIVFTFNSALVQKFKILEKTNLFSYENDKIKVIGHYVEVGLSRFRMYSKI